mgnify:CR=1 FL=1
MDPIHALIMALAIVAGVAIKRLQGPQPSALPRGQRIAVSLAAIIGGALGAKLPFILWDPQALESLSSWLVDGRTLTWGLAGGYLAVEGTKLSLGIKAKTGDGFAAPVAAAVAVGRLGCWNAGCCFGAPTSVPWAVDFGDGIMRHPTQLYEFSFHALACGVLFWMGRRDLFARQRIKLYLIAYMVYRFLTEWLRPEPHAALGLTFYQWSALAFGLALAAHFAYDRRAIPLKRV